METKEVKEIDMLKLFDIPKSFSMGGKEWKVEIKDYPLGYRGGCVLWDKNMLIINKEKAISAFMDCVAVIALDTTERVILPNPIDCEYIRESFPQLMIEFLTTKQGKIEL